MSEYINGKKVVEGYTEGARVYNNADITIANSTETALTFNTERYDTDSIHSTSSNTSRLTCQTAGKYLIIGQASFYNNNTGIRTIVIKLNNTTSIGQDLRAAPVGDVWFGTSTKYNLSVGDYVELKVVQTSGDNLDVRSAAAAAPEFMMQRIG